MRTKRDKTLHPKKMAKRKGSKLLPSIFGAIEATATDPEAVADSLARKDLVNRVNRSNAKSLGSFMKWQRYRETGLIGAGIPADLKELAKKANCKISTSRYGRPVVNCQRGIIAAVDTRIVFVPRHGDALIEQTIIDLKSVPTFAVVTDTSWCNVISFAPPHFEQVAAIVGAKRIASAKRKASPKARSRSETLMQNTLDKVVAKLTPKNAPERPVKRARARVSKQGAKAGKGTKSKPVRAGTKQAKRKGK